jgi:hypothetical protein
MLSAEHREPIPDLPDMTPPLPRDTPHITGGPGHCVRAEPHDDGEPITWACACGLRFRFGVGQLEP